AIALAAHGSFEESLQHYERVRTQRPDLDTSPELHLMFSAHQAESGQMNSALESARKALKLAQAYQDTRLTEAINERIAAYQEQLAQKP
ncbi:MAG TPA: hypothetical protein VNT26_01290, partial [Candidatus Sulfotelmatobacter sp.]|nr:hypothetical protein [Candidatus Sulfotelmatobacter sp.]